MRFGYCIFCDDIRTEIGEKLSFMGVYNGVMFVPSLPLTLSKFCGHVTLMTSTDNPYRSIRLKCFAPGEDRPLIEEELDGSQLGEQDKILGDRHDETDRPSSIVVAASLVFSPLRIRQPGLMTVCGEIDGDTVDIAALRILESHQV